MNEDKEISSCQEMDEIREQEETQAMETMEMRIHDMVRRAMHADTRIVAETDTLQEELSLVTTRIQTFRSWLFAARDAAKRQVNETFDYIDIIKVMDNEIVALVKTLQDLRTQNQAALEGDPIYLLKLEEQQLKQQLDQMGIHMFPSTASVEYD